ncbi:TolB family protein [Flavilitoribacter nigricans]|uniref:Uncharacterized protein n=1 Tax=Flavilitoribacter nigricans (strain ATCC 23147 / DSM 23189 / NBRC 102662 / NCIMB 1420 / SS-2) TaxID=1122177 RepID=A0A2D0N264_FLAN2|nr:PD40 domain-containing protein [Flavilitoribacter nigricans]PHN02632.1 hypothetical protein CRP01_31045 [Flavilitoribacter nigricans DSM 23189 = NBRC 102662]
MRSFLSIPAVGLLLSALFFSCSGPAPSAEAVIEAINRDSIPTQNGIALTPDYRYLYVSLPTDETNSGGRPLTRIYVRAWGGTGYGEAQEVSFNSRYMDYHPVLTPDGKRLYFNTNRPKPGSPVVEGTMDIWYVEKKGRGWSEPEYLYAINTPMQESYPSVDQRGILYFNSDRSGGFGSMDIWRYDPGIEDFIRPHWVHHINSAASENDLTVSPDGEHLIFNRYQFEDGSIDLYHSTWNGENWSEPALLDQVNEPDIWELTPTIGPQGKLFLYEREGIIRAMRLADVF